MINRTTRSSRLCAEVSVIVLLILTCSCFRGASTTCHYSDPQSPCAAEGGKVVDGNVYVLVDWGYKKWHGLIRVPDVDRAIDVNDLSDFQLVEPGVAKRGWVYVDSKLGCVVIAVLVRRGDSREFTPLSENGMHIILK